MNLTKKALLGLAVVGTLASCVKKDEVVPAKTSGTPTTAKRADDNYDNSDVLSILRRVNFNNKDLVPEVEKIKRIDVPLFGFVIHFYGHEGYRIDGPTPGTYQCPRAENICDITRVTIGPAKVVMSNNPADPNSPEWVEDWKETEMIPEGDVIVCTEGEPTYHANAHIETVGEGVYQVVPN